MTQINIKGIKRCFYASDNFTWLAPGETKELPLEVLWRDDKKEAVFKYAFLECSSSYDKIISLHAAK